MSDEWRNTGGQGESWRRNGIIGHNDWRESRISVTYYCNRCGCEISGSGVFYVNRVQVCEKCVLQMSEPFEQEEEAFKPPSVTSAAMGAALVFAIVVVIWAIASAWVRFNENF